MNQKIDFITYGDSSKYTISKKHIINLAKHSNFFNNCVGYSQKDLDDEFKNKFDSILKHERGGGYYIWKIAIIKSHLKYLNNNDILIYCDSGSSFNYFAKKRFFEYIEIINNSKYGNLRFESKENHIEKFWTTKELFNYFSVDINSKIANTPQLLGGHIIFKKNDHTIDFLNLFTDAVINDQKLITDFYDSNQIEEFIENRHDQSIMSLISKKYGGEILQNETFFAKNSEEQKSFPFLSVRNYGHGLKDRIKYNLGYKINTPIYF
tara:strand:+ start:36 stop:830 length:795 start_codon:yes stop_codon:yes gene_type:complete